MLKITWCGPRANKASTGTDATSAPPTKPADLIQRFPARLLSHIQISRTGETAALSSEQPAAAPARGPASALILTPGRATATIAIRNAATTSNRHSGYACDIDP